MQTNSKHISLLSVPFDLGASRRGASLGPSAVLSAGLVRSLAKLQVVVHDQGSIPVPDAIKENANAKLKHLEEIVQVNTTLAKHVFDIAATGSFPLVLGGDHSIAIGTIAGLAQHYQNLGVIWFDAHSDLNTEDTSPSGNIHGMSLGVGLGRGPSALTQIKGLAPHIKPQNVVIIGARQLDQGEREFIRASGITCFTMHEIDRMGMAKVIEESLKVVSKGTDGVHLSFDVDSLDPQEAPGTGTPIPGGVSYREAHFALELLYESGLITSAEFVEVNPSLDTNNKTARLTVELICSLLGQRIL
jgi:arginase